MKKPFTVEKISRLAILAGDAIWSVSISLKMALAAWGVCVMTIRERQRLDMVIRSLKYYGNRFDLEALKRKHPHFSVAVEPDGSVFVWVGKDLPFDSVNSALGWTGVDETDEGVLDVELHECIGKPGAIPGINLHNWRKYLFKIQ